MKHFIAILSTALALTACQSLPKATPATPTPIAKEDVIAFNINGKIGITSVTPTGKVANSAFYAWSQQDKRFGINLTGVLGIGATQISFDGTKASLSNDQIKLEAPSPNELLLKTTGWHAPIDTLPHWIMGKPAKGDVNSVFDNGKLSQSQNGDWTAVFDYPASTALPNRLRITHTDGHRVVLTINHQ